MSEQTRFVEYSKRVFQSCWKVDPVEYAVYVPPPSDAAINGVYDVPDPGPETAW